MTFIRTRYDKIVEVDRANGFDDTRISLMALGLYCWLGDATHAAEAVMARFGIEEIVLGTLIRELREAGLIETWEAAL